MNTDKGSKDKDGVTSICVYLCASVVPIELNETADERGYAKGASENSKMYGGLSAANPPNEYDFVGFAAYAA